MFDVLKDLNKRKEMLRSIIEDYEKTEKKLKEKSSLEKKLKDCQSSIEETKKDLEAYESLISVIGSINPSDKKVRAKDIEEKVFNQVIINKRFKEGKERFSAILDDEKQLKSFVENLELKIGFLDLDLKIGSDSDKKTKEAKEAEKIKNKLLKQIDRYKLDKKNKEKILETYEKLCLNRVSQIISGIVNIEKTKNSLINQIINQKEKSRSQLESFKKEEKETEEKLSEYRNLEINAKTVRFRIVEARNNLEFTESFISVVDLFDKSIKDKKESVENLKFAETIFKKGLKEGEKYFLEILNSKDLRVSFYNNLRLKIREEKTYGSERSDTEISNLQKELIKKLDPSKKLDEKIKREALDTYKKLSLMEFGNLISKKESEKLKSMKKSDIITLILNILTLGFYSKWLERKQENIKDISTNLKTTFKKSLEKEKVKDKGLDSSISK